MYLIPEPANLTKHSGSIFIGDLTTIVLPANPDRALLIAAGLLADEMQQATSLRPRIVSGASPVAGAAITVQFKPEISGEQHYQVEIDAAHIAIASSGVAGAFYAFQTLRQMLRSDGVNWPLMSIDDQPDFPNRGFYHDVTRSKVPTLDTLKQLVDKLAYYKINQLQLYVEHTFAFARHSDIWGGADPLTAAEILELDDYCRARLVELVPSMSTFGHFYMALRSKRHEDLNELDVKGGELPFSYCDRMAHYTLDCQNPQSLELVRAMLAEYIPLFSSKYFNICCDETFDLGKGKNLALAEKVGKGKLYFDFLKKVIGIVSEAGRVPMFWGDVILQDPELIKELPAGTIALDWDYGPEVKRNDTAKFQQAGVPFYVCPGVSGWNKCVPQVNVASKNITRYAVKGKNLGAIGLLNTDWGDYGHINLLSTSYHGLALGAAAGWNTAKASNYIDFDRAWEVLELGATEPGFMEFWRDFATAMTVNWNHLEWLVDDSAAMANPNFENMIKDTCIDLEKKVFLLRKLLPKLAACLAFADPLDKLLPREFLVGFRGTILMHEAMLSLHEHAGRAPWDIADDLRIYERDLAELWLKRNKLGEYGYFRTQLGRIAAKLDELGREQR